MNSIRKKRYKRKKGQIQIKDTNKNISISQNNTSPCKINVVKQYYIL